MKDIKIRIPELLIIIIFLLNTNFLYLVNEINSDLILIFVILFIIYCFMITAKEDKKKKSLLGSTIIFLPILIITGSIAAKNSYSQSIWLGIRPQREVLVWWFSYFGIYRLITYDKLKLKNAEKIIYAIGLIELIEYSFFWLAKGNIAFIHIPYDYRYSNIRIRADTMAIIILFMIAMNNVLMKKEVKKNVILLLAILVFEICCAQTRLIIVSMGLSVLILFVLWKKSIAIKLFIIPIIIIGIIATLQTTIGQDIVESLIGEKDDTNLEIRDMGKEFYMQELAKSPIIGRGVVNTTFENSVILAHINEGIYVNDNGIIGFLWMYGLVGGIWISIIFGKIIFLSIKVYKNNKNYIGIIFCAMVSIMAINIICWWWNDSFIFTMFMIIASMEKINKNKEC